MAPKNIASTTNKAAVFILAAFAFFLTATAVQAGFEWVPANPPAAKPAEEVVVAPAVPAPAVQPAEPIQAGGITVIEPTLPMPGETPAPAAPAPQPAPVAAAPSPAPQTEPVLQPLQPAPLAGQSDMEMPQPVAATRQPQMQQIPTPVIEAPQSQSKIRVLEITPPPRQAAQTDITAPAPAEPEQQPGLAPPPRVIMPQDAPTTAMESTPNSEKLTIAPYPQVQERAETPATPIQSDAAEQDAAAVEELLPQSQPEEIAVVPEATQSPQDSGNVVGFGSDIPLALALREVVPTEYAFSFGPGVNPGYRVSWTGDKPWIDVVNEMVTPLDMVAHIRGNIVHISKAGDAPAAEPEQQTFIAPEEQAAPEQGAQLDGEPVPLMLHPIRSNISDPGETAQSQPDETISRIQEISASMPEPQPELENIEPASSDAAAPEDITSESGIQDILENISATAAAAPVWEAKKGDSLKTVLGQWSTKAGIELVWDASHDYSINSDISTDASFEDAVKTITANTTEGEEPQVKFLRDAETSELGIVVVKDKAESAQSSI